MSVTGMAVSAILTELQAAEAGNINIMQQVVFFDHHVVYFTLKAEHEDVTVAGFRVFNSETKFESIRDFYEELWLGPDLIQVAV